MMRTLLVALLLVAPSLAWGAEPFARASVEDGGNIVPGQQVRVDVDIFVPDFFTSPPQFPLFDLPNALVTLPEERAQNITQTIDGVQYSGIRRAYAIVPQASGAFTLPEIDIDLGYSVDGTPTRTSVKIPSVSFSVGGSTSADQQSIVFAARSLSLEQSFDRDAGSLKVGDALVRTITVTAEDTQAMMIPPIAAGSAEGLRQYEKSPKIEDGIAVGRETASRRTETYVYTADKDGSFVIPAVSYEWFDVASHETKSVALPPVTVAVSTAASETAIKPVVDDAQADQPHVSRQKIALAISAFLALVFLVWLALRLFPILARRIAEARHRLLSSHGYRLRLLRQTIRTGNETGIYSDLHTWSRSLGYRTLSAWVDEGPDDLAVQVDILSRKLFQGSHEELDRKKLTVVVGFEDAHRTLMVSALPPLNPSPPTAG